MIIKGDLNGEKISHITHFCKCLIFSMNLDDASFNYNASDCKFIDETKLKFDLNIVHQEFIKSEGAYIYMININIIII